MCTHALRVGDNFKTGVMTLQDACKIKEKGERVCDVDFIFLFLLKGNTVNDNKHPSYREGATQNLIPKEVQPFKILTPSKMACGWKGYACCVRQSSASPAPFLGETRL